MFLFYTFDSGKISPDICQDSGAVDDRDQDGSLSLTQTYLLALQPPSNPLHHLLVKTSHLARRFMDSQ